MSATQLLRTAFETVSNLARSSSKSRANDLRAEASTQYLATVQSHDTAYACAAPRVWGKSVRSRLASHATELGSQNARELLRREPGLGAAKVTIVALCNRCAGTGQDLAFGCPCGLCDRTGVAATIGTEIVTR